MTLSGAAAAHSAKGLAPFVSAPPLGLFQHPPINPKTGQERNGVWAYKLAVADEIAELVRELHLYCDNTEAKKRLPLIGEYGQDELGEIDNSVVKALLPSGHNYLFWEGRGGRPLARFVYTNMPEEVAWEGGELHLRESRFIWMETKRGAVRRHILSPQGYRVED